MNTSIPKDQLFMVALPPSLLARTLACAMLLQQGICPTTVLGIPDDAIKSRRQLKEALASAQAWKDYDFAQLAREMYEGKKGSADHLYDQAVIHEALRFKEFRVALSCIFEVALYRGYRQAYDFTAGWCVERDEPEMSDTADLTLTADRLFSSRADQGECYQPDQIGLGGWGSPRLYGSYGLNAWVSAEELYRGGLDLLVRRAAGLGAELARLRPYLVDSILCTNPVLPDGKPLFDSAAGNLLTGSESMLSPAALARAMAMLAPQGGATAGALENGPYLIHTQGRHDLFTEANDWAPEWTSAGGFCPRQRVGDSAIDPRTKAPLAEAPESWFLAAPSSPTPAIEVCYPESTNRLPYVESRYKLPEYLGIGWFLFIELNVTVLNRHGLIKATGV